MDVGKASEQMPAIASNAVVISTEATGVMKDTKRLSGALAAQAGDLAGLLSQTQETLRQTDRLIEGIQRHWLLRKYIPQPSSTELISPLDVPSPKGGDR